MAALTADAIVDRARSICVGTFSLVEAPDWVSWERVPTQAIDGCFRIPPPSSQSVRGGFDFWEQRTDTMQIWVARKHNSDFDAVRRTLLRDVHSLTSAVVRDGLQVSGDYVVPDEGRGHSIDAEPETEFVVLRLALPINYDSQL